MEVLELCQSRAVAAGDHWLAAQVAENVEIQKYAHGIVHEEQVGGALPFAHDEEECHAGLDRAEGDDQPGRIIVDEDDIRDEALEQATNIDPIDQKVVGLLVAVRQLD